MSLPVSTPAAAGSSKHVAKHVVVTGASRGIGRATALACGRLGWRVVVNYAQDRAAALDTARAVEAAGGRALAAQADVSDEDQTRAMFEAATATFGALDGAVVNAGIVAPVGPFLDMSAQRWRRLFDVNVVGAMICAREAAARMVRSRGGAGGSIVLLSSAAARLGSPNMYVDYAASKGAIDTLALGLGRELCADGVRVNAVRPGIVETDIHAAAGDPDRVARMAPDLPMRRAGGPDEIAQAIVFLLSDAASYMTGALVDVTGGR
jgi:NAD(P)-dependent dehydrogenase (short-subunit alcohol dehydrogenase family)